jgi:hypothetical protein
MVGPRLTKTQVGATVNNATRPTRSRRPKRTDAHIPPAADPRRSTRPTATSPAPHHHRYFEETGRAACALSVDRATAILGVWGPKRCGASAARRSFEPRGLRFVTHGFEPRGRSSPRGRAMVPVGWKLAAVGFYCRTSRRRHARTPHAPPRGQLLEVGAKRKRARGKRGPPIRRGNQLGVFGVLAVRPRPAGHSADSTAGRSAPTAAYDRRAALATADVGHRCSTWWATVTRLRDHVATGSSNTGRTDAKVQLWPAGRTPQAIVSVLGACDQTCLATKSVLRHPVAGLRHRRLFDGARVVRLGVARNAPARLAFAQASPITRRAKWSSWSSSS